MPIVFMKKLVLIALLIPTALFAQKKLTINEIYDPANKNTFSASPQKDFVWIDDDHFFWPRRNAAGDVVADVLVDAKTGRDVAMFDNDDLQAQVRKIEGVSDDDAKKLSRPATPAFNPKNNALLVTVGGDLYVYSIADKKLTRLTSAPGDEEEASFSPDGQHVAFLRGNDLYVVDASGTNEHRLTNGGSKTLFNGKLDWVYQEEIYGRGIFKGYWWSPDSKSIAYIQLESSKVKPYTVVDHIPYDPLLEVTDYPLAGDPNPVARLFVVDATTASQREINIDEYRASDPLIVSVSWTPDSSSVVAQIQDREQTWLDLTKASRSDGQLHRILREKTQAWVEPSPAPNWLRDGSFLWLSERSGYKHIYRVSADGATQTPVTSGSWEVSELHSVDEKRHVIYFSATERSPIGSDLYQSQLDGSAMKRLSADPGTHTVTMNPSMSRFLDAWSDVTTPTRVSLYASDGKLTRIVDENRSPLIAGYDLAKPSFLQVKTRDGFPMEAMIIRPNGFDPSKKYPVYEYTYSGPHAPQVKNAWGGTTYLFHQMLAQNGVVVWICDNRSASGKGIAPTWPIYKNFGPLELRDLEDGVAWLKQQPGIDPSHFILSGWSFGGFMTTYALTHSTAWSAGIAGGSVTDWRNYDSVYTERYMLTPQHNPEGYKTTAPRAAAANLHASLLLLHGLTDDNVHVQNTVQLMDELQKAGKQFELMGYPKSRHGVTDPLRVKHMRTLMYDFVMRNSGVGR
jgi:dipeptidyl-peptidase 4